MTLPSSGPLSLNQINGEFGRGTNLNAYRGTTWYTDAGSSGTFTTSDLGVNQFYGKRVDAPYRYGFGNLTFTNYGTYGYAYTTVTGGQPYALFRMYLIYTTSGKPIGGLVVEGSLDASGNFAQLFYIIGSGPEIDPYWYPAPRTNGFSLYQTDAYGTYVFCNNFYATS